jgi:hypothetical protein
MRQGKYLNIILTINAVLLTVLIWTQVADQPLFSGSAQAQAQRDAPLNAGAQRQKMIELLTEMKREAEKTRKLLESGNTNVKVTNLHEIRAETGRTVN